MIRNQVVKLPRINQRGKITNEPKKVKAIGIYTEKPSRKFTQIKTIDPFADSTKLNANSFAYVYQAGGIPCKINHNSCGSMKVTWNPGIDINTLAYDPVLVTCFDGLLEEGYPYCALAKTAIEEMGASEKVIPLIPKLLQPLRQALRSKSKKIFSAALDVVIMLSEVVGSHLNSILKQLIVPMNKRSNQIEFRDKIFYAFRLFEDNGGPNVYDMIKAAIPTYQNI